MSGTAERAAVHRPPPTPAAPWWGVRGEGWREVRYLRDETVARRWAISLAADGETCSVFSDVGAGWHLERTYEAGGLVGLTYDEAMMLIHRRQRRVVARAGGGEISWRFGHAVLLGEGRTHVAYTPTREDMTATDWMLVR